MDVASCAGSQHDVVEVAFLCNYGECSVSSQQRENHSAGLRSCIAHDCHAGELGSGGSNHGGFLGHNAANGALLAADGTSGGEGGSNVFHCYFLVAQSCNNFLSLQDFAANCALDASGQAGLVAISCNCGDFHLNVAQSGDLGSFLNGDAAYGADDLVRYASGDAVSGLASYFNLLGVAQCGDNFLSYNPFAANGALGASGQAGLGAVCFLAFNGNFGVAQCGDRSALCQDFAANGAGNLSSIASVHAVSFLGAFAVNQGVLTSLRTSGASTEAGVAFEGVQNFVGAADSAVLVDAGDCAVNQLLGPGVGQHGDGVVDAGSAAQGAGDIALAGLGAGGQGSAFCGNPVMAVVGVVVGVALLLVYLAALVAYVGIDLNGLAGCGSGGVFSGGIQYPLIANLLLVAVAGCGLSIGCRLVVYEATDGALTLEALCGITVCVNQYEFTSIGVSGNVLNQFGALEVAAVLANYCNVAADLIVLAIGANSLQDISIIELGISDHGSNVSSLDQSAGAFVGNCLIIMGNYRDGEGAQVLFADLADLLHGAGLGAGCGSDNLFFNFVLIGDGAVASRVAAVYANLLANAVGAGLAVGSLQHVLSGNFHLVSSSQLVNSISIESILVIPSHSALQLFVAGLNLQLVAAGGADQPCIAEVAVFAFNVVAQGGNFVGLVSIPNELMLAIGVAIQVNGVSLVGNNLAADVAGLYLVNGYQAGGGSSVAVGPVVGLLCFGQNILDLAAACADSIHAGSGFAAGLNVLRLVIMVQRLNLAVGAIVFNCAADRALGVYIAVVVLVLMCAIIIGIAIIAAGGLDGGQNVVVLSNGLEFIGVTEVNAADGADHLSFARYAGSGLDDFAGYGLMHGGNFSVLLNLAADGALAVYDTGGLAVASNDHVGDFPIMLLGIQGAVIYLALRTVRIVIQAVSTGVILNDCAALKAGVGGIGAFGAGSFDCSALHHVLGSEVSVVVLINLAVLNFIFVDVAAACALLASDFDVDAGVLLDFVILYLACSNSSSIVMLCFDNSVGALYDILSSSAVGADLLFSIYEITIVANFFLSNGLPVVCLVVGDFGVRSVVILITADGALIALEAIFAALGCDLNINEVMLGLCNLLIHFLLAADGAGADRYAIVMAVSGLNNGPLAVDVQIFAGELHGVADLGTAIYANHLSNTSSVGLAVGGNDVLANLGAVYMLGGIDGSVLVNNSLGVGAGEGLVEFILLIPCPVLVASTVVYQRSQDDALIVVLPSSALVGDGAGLGAGSSNLAIFNNIGFGFYELMLQRSDFLGLILVAPHANALEQTRFVAVGDFYQCPTILIGGIGSNIGNPLMANLAAEGQIDFSVFDGAIGVVIDSGNFLAADRAAIYEAFAVEAIRHGVLGGGLYPLMGSALEFGIVNPLVIFGDDFLCGMSAFDQATVIHAVGAGLGSVLAVASLGQGGLNMLESGDLIIIDFIAANGALCLCNALAVRRALGASSLRGDLNDLILVSCINGNLTVAVSVENDGAVAGDVVSFSFQLAADCAGHLDAAGQGAGSIGENFDHVGVAELLKGLGFVLGVVSAAVLANGAGGPTRLSAGGGLAYLVDPNVLSNNGSITYLANTDMVHIFLTGLSRPSSYIINARFYIIPSFAGSTILTMLRSFIRIPHSGVVSGELFESSSIIVMAIIASQFAAILTYSAMAAISCNTPTSLNTRTIGIIAHTIKLRAFACCESRNHAQHDAQSHQKRNKFLHHCSFSSFLVKVN